jgi:RecJ-like exonuclease
MSESLPLISIDDDVMFIPCKECRGEGMIPFRRIQLYQICRKCGGEKYIDWVRNAMVKRNMVNERIEYDICDHNIRTLVTEIKLCCRDMGYDVDVQINTIPSHNHSINSRNAGSHSHSYFDPYILPYRNRRF